MPAKIYEFKLPEKPYFEGNETYSNDIDNFHYVLGSYEVRKELEEDAIRLINIFAEKYNFCFFDAQLYLALHGLKVFGLRLP